MALNKRAFNYKVGDKVNEWVINKIYYLGKVRNWECKCVCGNLKTFKRASEIHHQQSCGCGLDSVGLNAKQRRAVKLRLSGYKNGAKKRNFNWDLTYEDFVKLTESNCAYCGKEPKRWNCFEAAPSLQKDTPNTNWDLYTVFINGVDRVDSKMGYTIDNCVPCCTECNRAKNDMTVDAFKQHVKRMYEWLFQNE